MKLLKASFNDEIIEPQRQSLIPGFQDLKKKVSDIEDSLGFFISGAGPSVFAWSTTEKAAKQITASFSSALYNPDNVNSDHMYCRHLSTAP